MQLEQALCRATGQTGPAAPVSAGGFAESRVSGKGQDNEHLRLRLFLPATSSDSRQELCSCDNNNQAYQGTDSSQHSQGGCQRNYSPPGQNHFHSINDPGSIAQCHCAVPPPSPVAVTACRSSINTTGRFLQLKLQPTECLPWLRWWGRGAMETCSRFLQHSPSSLPVKESLEALFNSNQLQQALWIS